MRAKIVYSLAGLLAGLSGAIFASAITLPHSFTAGTQAVAAQVNANFSALLGAVNALDERVTGLENYGLKSGLPVVAITQTPAALGTEIIVGNATYTVQRFKAPALASGTSIVIDFPTAGGGLEVGKPGSFDFDSLDSATFVTTLSGRTVACTDTTYYNAFPGSQEFAQNLHCMIIIDADSWARLDFDSSFFADGAASGSPPDLSGIDPYAIVPDATQRNANRDALRSLLKYVVIS